MPLSHRRYATDEELAKRDDDRKYRVKPSANSTWIVSSPLRRRRLLTFGILVLFSFALYQLATRLQSVDDDRGSTPSFRFRDILPAGHGEDLDRPPPHDGGDAEAVKHYYNGPINLYKLAVSLHSASRTFGFRPKNQNVLFVTGSLKSTSELIPMACEMARWRRSDVHFALVGRNDVTVKDIIRINGMDGLCDVTWHDARPDYAPYSSDARMQAGVDMAIVQLHTFIHPQVVLADGSDQEDPVLSRGLVKKLRALSVPVISLPPNPVESMMWITRLDSGSLSAWNKAELDILIHAPERSSGGLIRLLKSLSAADYISDHPPRITIDLPPMIDPPTQRYLDDFSWPAYSSLDRPNSNRLSLHHRVSSQGSSLDDTPFKLIESFYPASAAHSHVLVLSPQVEVSPLYYHYAKYAMLEYKYSAYGYVGRDRLAGISLHLPTKHLNDSAPLTIPSSTEPDTRSQSHESPTAPHFLYQAPNSNAALYFGDKWAELHDFVRRRLEAQEMMGKSPVSKLTSKNHPAWLEHVLELFRLRRYYMLYPNLGPANRFVAVHHELFEPRDDDDRPDDPNTESTPPDISSTDEIRDGQLTGHASLLAALPGEGDLPELESMPVMTYDGERSSLHDDHPSSTAFMAAFKRDIGGCSDADAAPARYDIVDLNPTTADLFCLPDDAEDDAMRRVAVEGRGQDRTGVPVRGAGDDATTKKKNDDEEGKGAKDPRESEIEDHAAAAAVAAINALQDDEAGTKRKSREEGSKQAVGHQETKVLKSGDGEREVKQ